MNMDESGGDEGGGGLGVVLPLVGESEGSAVVAGQSVDAGFNENDSVLGILVLSALLQMSADVDGLLDEAVDVLGDFGSRAYMARGVPFFLRSLTIFCPVRSLMLGTASRSRMATPIWEGLMPFLAMVTMRSEMDLGV